MLESTRELLLAWRAELEDEIAGTEQNLATLNEEIVAAAVASAAESARIGDIDATLFKFGGRHDLAKPLFDRINTARRVAPDASRCGLVESREGAELRLAELHKAAIQVEALLAPPLLRLVNDAPRLSAVPVAGFDPIVMPRGLFA